MESYFFSYSFCYKFPESTLGRAFAMHIHYNDKKIYSYFLQISLPYDDPAYS